MANKKESFISFPPGTLDRESLRIPVAADSGTWFALDKPSAVPCFPDPWVPRPTDLVREIRKQIRDGKGQLKDLGISGIERINHLDFEASGLVLCARSEAEGKRLANCLGSSQIEFTYLLLVRGAPHSPELVCRLPLAPHATQPMMIGSRDFGKKCETHFVQRERFQGYALVEATTNFDRLHQVRVHGFESGLKIVGERKYIHVDPVFLSELKPDYRAGRQERESPLYDRLCMHLSKISFPGEDGSTVTIERGLPPRFRVLLERLAKHTPV